MIVRAIDQNHDWRFGKGKSDYKRDNQAVAQNIDTGLLCFLGDCFFDIEDGIDWFNLLGGKDRQAVILAVRARIISRQNVKQLLELSAVLDENRKLNLNYAVLSTFSTTPLTGSTGVL